METSAERTVTREDIDLVLTAMVRREVVWLRTVGWVAEVVGWAALAAALAYGAVQWDQLDFNAFDGGEIERWRSVVGFLLPQVMNLAATGLLLVMVGRGGRLLALHLAARRGINITGLAIGETIDEIDLAEDD